MPSPGRAPRGEGEVPAPARQHRWVAAGAGGSSARQGRSLCPLGRLPLWPVAVCGCRRGPGGSRGSVPHVWGGRSGRCRGPAQTTPALVRCRPQPRGLLVVALCHRCCCCVGLNPPRFSQTLALARSPGEKGDVAGLPSPSLPPLPSRVHGTGEPLPKAPGRAARAREAAGFAGAAAARGLCGHSLTVPRLSLCRDGRTEEPSHAGSCGAPRKKPGCLRPGRRCRLPRSWLGTALPRPAGDAAAPAQLFGPPFVLGPVPIAGAVGLVVRAPVCCCSSSWTAPVPFAGPAQLWFLFQLVDGSGSFPCPLADGSSSSLAAAPAPRHFQLVCGSSSCLLKRSWLLARS